MNNTFSIQRFGLILKRQWLEFGKIYLVSLLVALGVFIVFYGIGLWEPIMGYDEYSERDLSFREPLFAISGLIFISIIASSYFAHLGQKPKAIIDLLTPASTFEKFMAGIFFTAILSVFSFWILFYLTDLVFIAKIRAMNPEIAKIAITGKEQGAEGLAYFFSKNNPNEFIALYTIPFFVTSVFLLGSIYFNKFHYIKTAICVMIFAGIWSYIVFNTVDKLMEGRIPVENSEKYFNAHVNTAEILATLLVTLLTLIFWGITYVRLKEKEV